MVVDRSHFGLRGSGTPNRQALPCSSIASIMGELRGTPPLN
jgi:hypothetical protein